MGTWTSSAVFQGDPRQLLAVLTEIESIERWSPVPFRVADGADCLRAGEQVAVEGALVGRAVRFRVDVDRADEAGISLRASGAFEIDVDYCIDREAASVVASVQARGRGALARILASVANAMLSAGALERVLDRVISEAAVASACVVA